jgi:hypothetical protein
LRIALVIISLVNFTAFSAVQDTVDYWNIHLSDSPVFNYSWAPEPDDKTIVLKLNELNDSEFLKAERISCGLPCWSCASILVVKNESGKTVFESEQNNWTHKIPLNILSQAQTYTCHFQGGSDWDNLPSAYIFLYIKVEE